MISNIQKLFKYRPSFDRARAVRLVSATGALLYKRIPYFALAFLSVLALLYSGREIYRYMAPGEWYFSYVSLDVADGVEAGQPVPYQACRDKTGEFEVDVVRNIYLIPNTNKPSERSLEKQSVFQNARTSDIKCIDSFIRLEEYNHNPGNYQIVMYLGFDIGGNDKTIAVESNIYQVDSPALTNEDLIRRIDELERELDELRSQLNAQNDRNQATVNMQNTQPPNEPVTTSEPNNEPIAASAAPSERPAPQSNPQPQALEPQPGLLERVAETIGGLL